MVWKRPSARPILSSARARVERGREGPHEPVVLGRDGYSEERFEPGVVGIVVGRFAGSGGIHQFSDQSRQAAHVGSRGEKCQTHRGRRSEVQSVGTVLDEAAERVRGGEAAVEEETWFG